MLSWDGWSCHRSAKIRGQLFPKDNATPWTLQTKTESSFQHSGEIAKIGIKLSNTKTNTLTVYGLSPAGTSTVIATPEKKYWSSSEDYYEYDFSEGAYNGFRIESGSKITVYMLRVFYYAPTGD